jgi:hypothetical protein
VRIGLDDLTSVEQAVLLVLMAEARPVPNPELARLGPELTKQSRDKLNKYGLVESTRPGRSYVHELSDDGWALCRTMFGTTAPARSPGQGRALYTLMRGLDRYFTQADLPLAEVFSATAPVPVAEATDNPSDPPATEPLIRAAYLQLAPEPTSWVGLARLRSQLPHLERHRVDDTLRQMYRTPGVHLIPEENQKVLTDSDRAAAVEIGGQNKHLIAIEL